MIKQMTQNINDCINTLEELIDLKIAYMQRCCLTSKIRANERLEKELRGMAIEIEEKKRALIGTLIASQLQAGGG